MGQSERCLPAGGGTGICATFTVDRFKVLNGLEPFSHRVGGESEEHFPNDFETSFLHVSFTFNDWVTRALSLSH